MLTIKQLKSIFFFLPLEIINLINSYYLSLMLPQLQKEHRLTFTKVTKNINDATIGIYNYLNAIEISIYYNGLYELSQFPNVASMKVKKYGDTWYIFRVDEVSF